MDMMGIGAAARVALLILLAAPGPAPAQAGTPRSEAPVEVQVYGFDGGELKLHFDLRPGVYVFRDSVRVLKPGDTRPMRLSGLPRGGRVVEVEGMPPQSVIAEGFEAWGRASNELDVLTVEYRGCSTSGLCYLPRRQEVLIQWIEE